MFTDLFPPSLSVLSVVVLGDNGIPVRKFRLARSVHDVARHFPLEEGRPVIGPRVFREPTKAERQGGQTALIPLCNIGRPWSPPAAA